MFFGIEVEIGVEIEMTPKKFCFPCLLLLREELFLFVAMNGVAFFCSQGFDDLGRPSCAVSGLIGSIMLCIRSVAAANGHKLSLPLGQASS